MAFSHHSFTLHHLIIHLISFGVYAYVYLSFSSYHVYSSFEAHHQILNVSPLQVQNLLQMMRHLPTMEADLALVQITLMILYLFYIFYDL